MCKGRGGRGSAPSPVGWLPVMGVLAACTGSGSDVGPRLADLPGDSFQVIVLDDTGAAVSGARIAVAGRTGATGRSGRADLDAAPSGRQLVQIDTAAAAADPSPPELERLRSLAFVADVQDRDLPFAVFLPDTGPSIARQLATGGAVGSITVDDSAQSGAILAFTAGTVLQDDTGASNVTLRLAALAREHLPADLPLPPAGTWLVSRGIWIDPPTVTFAPAATLSIPDDLGLGASDTAVVLHLDAATGEWQQVPAVTATGSGGVLQGPVAGGGLYAFAFASPAGAIVRGRAVDTEGRGLPRTLVRVDSTHAVAGDDGRFALTVAGELAAGSARAVNLELRSPGAFAPAAATFATAALGSGADVDLGDLVLDAVPAANVRVQLIFKGRAVPGRRLPFSSVDGLTGGVAFADADGQCTLEDLGTGFYGFDAGHPLDQLQLLVTQGVGFLPAGRRWDRISAFYDDRGWVAGSRSTRAECKDALGGGPVRGAIVTRGTTPALGFSGTTTENGLVFVGRSFDGRATAALRSERGGNAVVSAFTIERPNGDRLELPLQQQLRGRGGAWDRHGVLAGSLTGFDAAREQRLRAQRPLEFDEWCDQVLLDAAATSSVPTLGFPLLAAGSYRAGAARPRGHVAVVEGTTAGSVFTPTAFGLLLDQTVDEGAEVARDLPIDLPADTTFTASGVLAGLDAALVPGDLVWDLALEQPSGLIVDVARGIDGGLTVAGQDLQLQLPALAGALQGHAWLVALRGRVTAGTQSSDQRALLRFAAASVDTALLPLPAITAPADGGTVAAAGFDVGMSLPADTLYAVIELRSTGTETLLWTAVVPGDTTTFPFVQLPPESPTPLVAGRSYTLQVTAARADTGEILRQQDPYRELTTHWMVIGAGERGVRAVSTRTIAVTAN